MEGDNTTREIDSSLANQTRADQTPLGWLNRQTTWGGNEKKKKDWRVKNRMTAKGSKNSKKK